MQIPKICGINEFDLCILFGNILDNAIEACERLPQDASHCIRNWFIHIQTKIIKKCFLLEAKNSTHLTDMHTTGVINKKKPQEHGIGLQNIRDVLHKYDGTANIEIKNNVFLISILIPLNNTVHDIKQAF